MLCRWPSTNRRSIFDLVVELRVCALLLCVGAVACGGRARTDAPAGTGGGSGSGTGGDAAACVQGGGDPCNGRDDDCDGTTDEDGGCAAGEQCVEGHCVCPPTSLCSGECHDLISDPVDCGACGLVCTSGPNAEAVCKNGICDALCASGWGNCDGSVATGCETDLEKDANNCGGCGITCAACSEGVCPPQVLAAGQERPRRVAVDDQHVYWTNFDAGQVMRAAKSGGQPVVLDASHPAALAVALDDDFVYWSYYWDGLVMRMPKTGGPSEVVASEQDGPDSIAVHGDRVYWTNIGFGPGADGSVMSCMKNGQGFTTIASKQTYPSSIAVSEKGVFWASQGLLGAPHSDLSALAALASGTGVWAVAVDATRVYWTDVAFAELRRIDQSGGNVATLSTGGGYGTDDQVAVDDTFAYWSAGQKLVRVPKSGGPAKVLVPGPCCPTGVAVDAKHVYYVNPPAGSVLRVPKPSP